MQSYVAQTHDYISPALIGLRESFTEELAWIAKTNGF
jgi:hypothetical protein